MTGVAGESTEQVAESLVRAGVHVALADLDAGGAQVAGELQELAGTLVAFPVDVRSPAEIEGAVADAEAALGPISIGVAGAGLIGIVPALGPYRGPTTVHLFR